MAKKGKIVPEEMWAKPAWSVKWMRRVVHWGPWGFKICSFICGLRWARGHYFTYKKGYLRWPAKFGEKPVLSWFCTWCGCWRKGSEIK